LVAAPALGDPREVPGERLERAEISHRQKVIDVRERGRHALGERPVSRGAEQRVEPDQPVAAIAQLLDLLPEQGGRPGVEAIADDQDHRAAPDDPARVAARERVKALADPRAPGEVDDLEAGAIERGVDVAELELGGDAGQPGAEDEDLGAAVAAADGVEDL
jgi:hypothetical protein